MQWGQIKTLLILSFLILDIYLLAQFLEKKELSDIAIWEEQSSSIEDQLKAENITFDDLPEQEYEESFISVEQHDFEKEELKETTENTKQTPLILDKYLIMSVLDKPVKIAEDASVEDVEESFKDIVYMPDEYSYWSWDKELNIIIFFQNKKERPVYYNQNGLVLLFLNDDNEVAYYSQTMLGETEKLAEKQTLISPMQAIETLYVANELQVGDNIENVKIGFHTRVPFDSDVQVFAPIWKVNVNEEQDYFVNAIEAFIFSTKEQEFLLETIDNYIDQLDQARDQKDMVEEIKKDLEGRITYLEEDGVS